MSICLTWMLWAGLCAGEPFSAQSYEEARAAALAADKLFLVDATAAWCGPCKRMEQTTWADASVRAALAGTAVAVQLDVDAHPEQARRLRISAMPTLILFRDEEEIARHTGFLDAAGFLAWYGAYVATADQLASLQAEHERLRTSDDPVARLQFGEQLTAASIRQDAPELVEMAVEHLLWAWDWRAAHPGEPLPGLVLLPQRIRDLSSRHAAAKRAFQQRIEAAFARLSDPATATAAAWSAWFELSEVVEQDRDVLDWFERVKGADGRVDPPGLEAQQDETIRSLLFDTLVRHGRYADACHLGLDVLGSARRDVAMYRNTLESGQLESLPEPARSEFVASERQELRTAVARLYGIAAAAEEEPLADALAALLFESLDDGASRAALVEAAIGCAAARRDVHSTWLAEAEEDGVQVDALRRRL